MRPADHYRRAEALIASAEVWLDREVTEFRNLTVEDSAARRASDLLAAQTHLLAAQVGLAATVDYSMDDRDDWQAAFAGYQLGEPEVTR